MSHKYFHLKLFMHRRIPVITGIPPLSSQQLSVMSQSRLLFAVRLNARNKFLLIEIVKLCMST